MNVFGHISRCTCVSFSRVYSRKWNCWVGGCAHLQLYQLPNFSQKWLHQQYFSKFIFLKSLPQTLLQPLPHVISYKSPKSSGLAGPQGKEETGSGTAETSVSWECGRGWEKFSGQHMWIIRVESDSAGWWMQLPGVPRHQSCKSWRASSFWWAREGPLNHFPK